MPEFDLDAALAPPRPAGRYLVDLHDSVWSVDTSTWKQSARKAWAALKDLRPSEEVEIVSEPTQTRGSARILISRAGSGMWCAEGEMQEQWDDISDLHDQLRLPKKAEQFLYDLLPFASGEVGVSILVSRTASSLVQLMTDVCNDEDLLGEHSDERWEAIQDAATAWLENAAARRRDKRRTGPV